MKSEINKFSWTLVAQHVTSTWDYYITRTGWNTNKPLKRADFQKFCTVDDKMKKLAAKVTHTCKVPERSGYHVILAVWNIGNTKNAFYNFIDADFGGKQVKPTEPDKKPDVKPVVPDTKSNVRDWNSKSTYTTGNEVMYKGALYKAQWRTSGDTPGKAGVWKSTTTATATPKNWDKKQTYIAGDQAMLGRLLYEAKSWTRGNVPSNSTQWTRK